MKNTFNKSVWIFAVILLGGFAAVQAMAGDDERKIVVTSNSDAGDRPAPPAPPQVVIRTVASEDDKPDFQEAVWLGVGVEESSEPLSAQLGLKPGEGLVVNYVSTNSPAAAAGLQRNDVLVGLDEQMLVDDAQLRKLVRMHADGDSVKISFYRAGRLETVSARLTKKTFDELSFDSDALSGSMGNLRLLMHDLRNQSGDLNNEMQGTMDQARQMIQETMRESFNGTDAAGRSLEIIHKKLGDLANGGVNLTTNATVVIKNEGESTRTLVKTDADGTYVIVADPGKHLTVHNKKGRLIFDGPIETLQEQQKVPKELWKKVGPLTGQLEKGSVETASPPSP